MAAFKIGINMAGAVSAGAYTAGVLDFLTEAIDEWYKAKARNEQVPMHDVSIEVFTGASAGGMCSAISAVLLQREFEHIHETIKHDSQGEPIMVGGQPVIVENTTNLLYESWVNKIDIRHLLTTDDIQKGQPVVSMLNSAIIQEIAQYALNAPAAALTAQPPLRPWVAPDLTLFLSLTNLRGVPYSLNAAAPGSLEETTFFYGARIGFQTVRGLAPELLNHGLLTTGPLKGCVRALDLEKPGSDGGWIDLQTAAMSTGAFPVFLKPRVLSRFASEFIPPHWLSVMPDGKATLPPIEPGFPESFHDPLITLNVDGGITNNDPFNYAHDYLSARDPSTQGVNPRSPLAADRAVINIAPFPTIDAFNPDYDPVKSSFVLTAFAKLFSALISQSRFYGESLNEIMTGETFSRFVIAPSDDKMTKAHAGSPADQPPALQCASLGAFGGFLERGFRAHDFMLGRRNCQKFLRDSFVLPVANPIMSSALASLDAAARESILKTYTRPAPGTYGMTVEKLQEKGLPIPESQADAGVVWLPIIPLCTEYLQKEMPEVKRAQLSHSSLDLIVKLIRKRYWAVVNRLIDPIPARLFRWFLRAGQPFIAWWVAGILKKSLIKNLRDAYSPKR